MLYTVPSKSAEDYSGVFFAHENLLSRLLTDLPCDDPGYTPQHQLLLGNSGIGKTTFLIRFERAVIDDSGLNRQWLPLLINSHFNVDCAADFWRNCITALIEKLDLTADAALIEALYKQIDGSAADDFEALLSVLLREVGRNKKRLLLLIDDIDRLLQRSEEIYIELFVALQNQVDILVVATCSQPIWEFLGNDTDFYELFNVDEFNRMQETEIGSVLSRLGQTVNAPRVEEFINQNPDAAKMLVRLTGGIPRTVSLISRFIADGLEGDFRYKVEQMLDSISPDYLARLSNLTIACQKLVDLICCNWQPLAQSEIAQKRKLDVSVVSADLIQLEEQAVIERITNLEDADDPLFQISERLFNIWYLMYRGQPNSNGSVWLAYFLDEFFSVEALEIRARDHIQMPSLNKQEIDYTVALTQVLPASTLCAALEFSVLQALTNDGWSSQAIHRMFYWKHNDPELISKIERLQRLKTVESIIEKSLADTSIVAQPFCDALLGSPTLTEEEKVGIADEATGFSQEKWTELDNTLLEELVRWRQILGHHAVALYKSIASGEMSSLADTEGAENAAVHWQDPVVAAISWAAWIDQVENPSDQELEKAERAFRAGLDTDPNVAVLWNGLGNILQYFFDGFSEAEQAYRRAIRLDPDYSAAWSQLAHLLKNHLKSYSDAEAAYRRLIELEPENPKVYNNLAWFLYQHRKRIDEAIKLSKRAIELAPDDLYCIHTCATLLVKGGRWEDAEPYLRRFLADSRDNDQLITNRAGIILFQEIVNNQQIAQSLALLEELDGADRWKPMAEAIKLIESEETEDLSDLDPEIAELVGQIVDGIASPEEQ